MVPVCHISQVFAYFFYFSIFYFFNKGTKFQPLPSGDDTQLIVTGYRPTPKGSHTHDRTKQGSAQLVSAVSKRKH
jgi:hypothetical protein